jgi:CRISPR-associated protein Cmr2
VSEAYWQAKIWGLLHDPALKALHNNTGRGGNSFWSELAAMKDWREHGWNPETSGGTLLQHIHLADYIASASDRAAIGSLSTSVNYAPTSHSDKGLEIRHLLSGEKLDFKLKDAEHQRLIQSNRADYLNQLEQELLSPITAETDCKKVFWWLWRCLPEEVCQKFQDDESLMLMPAETRLPDASIWSHTSITAALAGGLAGYNLTQSDIQARWSSDKILSHPYLATFSFTPVQELIKASRKMRDFWAGSWILHYLSTKVCWKLSSIYGPDSLLYPSLYQQPLIDHWLLQTWPDFDKWINKPSSHQLLTAGFPNVLVLVLPKDAVPAAMQTAHQTLLEEWRQLGNLVFKELKTERRWMPELQAYSQTWAGWLNAQWQTYWTALPIGVEGEDLKNAAIPDERSNEFQPWQSAQNHAYNLMREKEQVFQPGELDFLRAAYQHRWEKQGRRFSVNVGSWWPYIFDQTRFALTAVKNARTWQLPTAFGPRSTVSGIGPVVHPGDDWITEGKTKQLWQRQAGLFDGREQLNATETLKRGIHKVLPQMFNLEEVQIAASYPDLTAGVAGYLKVNNESEDHRRHFYQTCQAVINEFPWAAQVVREMRGKWGIPWEDNNSAPKKYHPRLLNAGWLVEDAQTEELEALQQDLKSESDPTVVEQLSQEIGQLKVAYRSGIQKIIDQHYPSNNPADWYVLAAGDGDGMSEWLKGKKLKSYEDYIASDLEAPVPMRDTFEKFLKLPKRMGPATHNALSRALLDFSNQLVPYLSEQRYAGRLIYGGGDDVLAYTNLWEWDKWLWDIRQCFRGDKDPKEQFESEGDYWRWLSNGADSPVSKRPLFTMGSKATISFGVVVANQSIPLAIALENLWAAEKEAKEHKSPNGDKKDAVQVRVLYSNGNTLNATSKFGVFHSWQSLLNATPNLESAMFEQAAQLWSQHPAPVETAITP